MQRCQGRCQFSRSLLDGAAKVGVGYNMAAVLSGSLFFK